MAKRPKIALDALRRVSAETLELFDRLSKAAVIATDHTSEVLVGIAGGALFLLLAYGSSVALPAISFAIGGPIAACIGLPLGILAWRGRRRFRIEKVAAENRLQIEGEIAANRLKADEVMKRLKSLPKDAPQQVRDALYIEYLALTGALRSGADELAPLPALPPPSQQPLALPPPASDQRQEEPVEIVSRERRISPTKRASRKSKPPDEVD